jgi:hypothetical protein
LNQNPIKNSLSQRVRLKISSPRQLQESRILAGTPRTATAGVFADAAGAVEAAGTAAAMAVIVAPTGAKNVKIEDRNVAQTAD